MNLATVTLPDNVRWRDEFAWSAVTQATERTLSGAMVVEETPRQSGRPITLEGLWCDRSTVEALRTLEEQVATEMTLDLPDGRTFTVLWRRDSEPALRADPLLPAVIDPDPDELYEVTLRLMEA